MGLVTSALKSVGKEFLANKAADILDVSKKDTPVENTQQSDIPVDLSETTSMEDTYEPTVSDADENNPEIVEPDVTEPTVTENDTEEVSSEEDEELEPVIIPSISDYGWDGYGTTEDKYRTENNFYTGRTRKVPNPEYNPRARKNKKPEFLDEDLTFDSHPIKVGDDGNISFDQQQTEPTIPRGENGDAKVRVWRDYWGEPRLEWRRVRDIIGDREDYYNETMEMVRNGLKEAADKGDSEEVENIIEEHPEESQEVLPEDTPIQEEAEQITEDTTPQNDEVNNEVVEDFVEESAGNDQFKDIENKPYYDDWVKFWAANDKGKDKGKDKDNKKAGSSFINVPSDPKDTEPLPLVSGYKREGDKLLDEYGNEIPDYESIDTDGGVLTERDDDFLGQDEWVDEEGNIHDYSELANGNTEALNKEWYEGDESGEGEYSESGNVNLDYEAADLQDQIEEAEALPVTNAEEAKEKQNRLRALRLKLKEVQTATGSGSNVPSKGPTTDNGTQTTGGRVSPRAGIGSIGGGAAGHGSMVSTRPTKTGDSHNSIASKAPLPHALEDNQGKVVSVNGKATTAPSSNNNGAFRSGSFGLMSKAKSDLKNIPSKAPVSGGPEHMGSPMAEAGKGMPGDFNLEDGKQILIERLKQLLAQLTDDEKRKLGFSTALNQWNGKALTRLDGYTLQDLIDKTEKYLGEMNNGMAQ